MKLTAQHFTNVPKWNWQQPSNEERIPKYLPGDMFLTHDGGVGIISKINFSPDFGGLAQYASQDIPGFVALGKMAWWKEDEFKQVIKGPLHAIVESEVNPFTGDQIQQEDLSVYENPRNSHGAPLALPPRQRDLAG